MDAKVRSMTGYGRGEFTAEDRKFTVEMRSVNHRYNDITVKLPRFLISLEDRIKKKTAENVFRGKTDIYISFETLSSEDVEVKLDEALAAAYAEKLKHLREIIGVPQADDGRILELTARFPDVITVEKAQKEEEVLWEILLPALEDAVSRFLVMRETEGENLKQDILQKGEKIRALVAGVKERAPLVVEEYREKLNRRLEDILGNVEVDPQRVAQEVAVFADRGCIDEEITRLESHLIQLDGILREGGQVGRKLDFLVQEMNRESNTIASKANDVQIVQATIALKSEIEKIREQVQNLE
ncbi:MAG: YicC family protein [Anaerotignum sp.]|nr:YicC family protein [Anaerotignum sp.]